MWIDGADLVWRYFDLGATFIWALTGALLAARRGYDLTGIAAIALVSSTGGGLLRDGIFLQQGPPALLLTPSYVAIVGLAAFLVWVLGLASRVLRAVTRVAVLVDAIGLGAFAVVGMHLAQRAQVSLPAVVLVGVVNAVGGGLLRNLLLQETPEVFRPGEPTALAALLGCFVNLALTHGLALDARLAAAVTIALVAVLRAGSLRYGFRTRAARGFVPAPAPEPLPPAPR